MQVFCSHIAHTKHSAVSYASARSSCPVSSVTSPVVEPLRVLGLMIVVVFAFVMWAQDAANSTVQHLCAEMIFWRKCSEKPEDVFWFAVRQQEH